MSAEDLRLGRSLKALRQRTRKRQRDVAAAAGVSQSAVSRVERGLIGSLPVHDAREVFAAVGARLDLRASWEGSALDRLLDEGHAALVELTATRLRLRGWTVVAEVSFSYYGERGSIDLLAWHAETRSLLVVEVKTELGAVEATLRTLDVKVRQAPRVARERFGWVALTTSRVLVFPDDRTVRRHVAAHAISIGTVMPLASAGMRAWIRTPEGTTGGVLFMTAGVIARPRPRRVRVKADTESAGTGSPHKERSGRPPGRSLSTDPVT